MFGNGGVLMIHSIQHSLVKKIIMGYFAFVLIPTLLVGMMYLSRTETA